MNKSIVSFWFNLILYMPTLYWSSLAAVARLYIGNESIVQKNIWNNFCCKWFGLRNVFVLGRATIPFSNLKPSSLFHETRNFSIESLWTMRSTKREGNKQARNTHKEPVICFLLGRATSTVDWENLVSYLSTLYISVSWKTKCSMVYLVGKSIPENIES